MSNPMNFIPKSKHFLLVAPTVSKGGIYLPENAQAIQDSMMNDPQLVVHSAEDSEFKKGDYIMVDNHVLTPVVLEGEDYFIVADYRVLGKVLNYTPKDKDKKGPKSSIILS